MAPHIRGERGKREVRAVVDNVQLQLTNMHKQSVIDQEEEEEEQEVEEPDVHTLHLLSEKLQNPSSTAPACAVNRDLQSWWKELSAVMVS